MFKKRKANRHARLKMSYEIQSLKLVVEKVLIWRCEHYLMTDKKIFAVFLQHNPQNIWSYAPAAPHKNAFDLDKRSNSC